MRRAAEVLLGCWRFDGWVVQEAEGGDAVLEIVVEERRVFAQSDG